MFFSGLRTWIAEDLILILIYVNSVKLKSDKISNSEALLTIIYGYR